MVSLYHQIRTWAEKNNWYKAHIISHKLWLQRNFGKHIRKTAVGLEAAGAAALAARIEREFSELLNTAGTFDKLCKKGCESEQDLAEFEHTKQQVRSAAFKLAQVLQTAEKTDKKPVLGSKIPIKEIANRPQTEDVYITFAEASTLLGVTKGTVSRWASQGRIKDNGKTGQGRKLSKTSALMLKEERQQQELAGDAVDLRRDAANIAGKH